MKKLDLYYLLKDNKMLPLFEIVIFSLLFIGIYQEIREKTGKNIKRGEKAQKQFLRTFNIFSSIVILGVINATEAFSEYHVILILSNLAIVFYLSFCNSWSKNKIIGFYSKYLEGWEKH